MVDGLVTLTRIDAEAAAHGTVDVAAVAADVVAAARRRHPQRADDLTLAADASGSVVDGDARELALAVSALVDNAVKYAPEGSIDVDVTATTVGDRPTVRVTVTDHGPGVDESALPHLFERFYRAPAARAAPGAGLGLALVERVAAAHGGRAAAAPAAPHGLSVTVELPARPALQARPAAGSGPRPDGADGR